MSKNVKTSHLSKTVRSGYLRLVEVFGIILVVAAIGVIGYFTLNVLKEENSKLGELEKESATLRKEIKEVKTTLASKKNKSSTTQAIIDNLDSFRERFLRDPEKGRIFVISELNNLAKKNTLSLVTGINFEKLEGVTEFEDKEDKKAKPSKRAAKKEKPTFYPGLSATFSIAGNYGSFRKFLYELETSKMFFVVEKLNLQIPDLESKTNSSGNPQRISTIQRAAQGNGEFIVQMQVTAYFRRETNATN